MGIANAQRALEVMRVFTEFISQPQYKDVVPMFGIMNEALLSTIGRPALSSLYVPPILIVIISCIYPIAF
jgi:glucan 1,3-beta-glucosidase